MKKATTLVLLLITFLISAQEYKFGKVSKNELNEKIYTKDSTASASYIYRERKTYYEYHKTEGFKKFTEVKERIKIYNNDGVEHGNLSLKYYDPTSGGKKEKITSLKAYTFNLEDGKVVKDKLDKKNIFEERKSKYYSYKKIAMPSVKKGSVIDIRYTISSPFLGDIRDVQFQFNIPVKKLKARIETPEWFIFNKRFKGFHFITPNTKSKKKKLNYQYTESGILENNRKISYTGSKEYIVYIDEYLGEDIPALKNDEPYVGSIKSYRGGMTYEIASSRIPGSKFKNYTTSWEDVCKRIFKNKKFGKELNKNDYFKNDLQSLIAGLTSEEEKLTKILHHLKTKIKWNDYYGKFSDKGVEKAYEEGSGNVADINLTLTSMLRTAGFNANPVLTSTKNNGSPLFPTIDGFNYVICMVEFANNTYVLLDASDPFSTPNVLPTRVLNWKGRKITKNGESSWVKLTPNTYNIEEHKVFGKITSDNTFDGSLRSTYANLGALNYRNEIVKYDSETITSKLENKHQIEINKFELKNKFDLYKPLIRSINFKTEEYIEDIQTKKYITPLLFFTRNRNPFKLKERKFPVDFGAPWKDQHTVIFSIPKGYKITKLPETIALSLPESLGFFKYQVISGGGK